MAEAVESGVIQVAVDDMDIMDIVYNHPEEIIHSVHIVHYVH